MTDTIRLIIAGSRDFDDYELLEREANLYLSKIINGLDKSITELVEIVSGGARGADNLGERYAKEHKIPLKIFKADWEKHKKSAGYIRNEEMAKYSNYCIIFNIGRSKGSVHMENIAKKYNLGLKVINL